MILSEGNLIWQQYLYYYFCTKWKRSKKGNLWCKHRGMTLTIFKYGKGYRYCKVCHDNPVPVYSQSRFSSEQEAIDHIWEMVNRG